jgi:hypothetical protein
MSSSRKLSLLVAIPRSEGDTDVVVITLIFNRANVEKTNPPWPLAVAEKEEEE